MVTDPFGVSRAVSPCCTVDPGSSILPVYGVEIGEDHIARRVQTGTHDLYEEIQSWKGHCGIENAKAQIASGRVDPSFYADKGSRNEPLQARDLSEDFVSAKMKADRAAARTADSRAFLDSLGFDSEKANDTEYVSGFIRSIEAKVNSQGGSADGK